MIILVVGLSNHLQVMRSAGPVSRNTPSRRMDTIARPAEHRCLEAVPICSASNPSGTELSPKPYPFQLQLQRGIAMEILAVTEHSQKEHPVHIHPQPSTVTSQ